MESSALSLVTIVLFLPMVGLTVLMFMNGQTQKQAIKWTALGFSIATLIGALLLWLSFDQRDRKSVV